MTTAIFAILSLPFLILLRSWVLMILWGWFVLPLGVPAIGMAHAYGLNVVTGLFLSSITTKTHKTTAEALGYELGAPLFMLLAGWITHLFMVG